MFFEVVENDSGARIKVVGVGGGGGNAINNMISSSLRGVTFLAANTDTQALNRSQAEFKLQLGEKLTKGLGAGANPEVGRNAALESIELIRNSLSDSEMVFITAGMGGGTGTGAAPVIAQVAKEMGALTVAVVTKPFHFEGRNRLRHAEEGINALKEVVDSYITIPNDRLLSVSSKKTTFLDMLKKADEILYFAVKGISDLIQVSGLINLDFADVKAAMSEMGMALMGIGTAKGEGRAREATQMAISSPLLEQVSISGAKAVILNITSGYDLTVDEINEATEVMDDALNGNSNINLFFGATFDEACEDEIRVTVVATGIDGESSSQPQNGLSKDKPEKQEPRQPSARPSTQPHGLPRTPRNDLRNSTNLEVPAYIRNPKNPDLVSGELPSTKGKAIGGEEFVFDEDETEIPAFIRMQAD